MDVAKMRGMRSWMVLFILFLKASLTWAALDQRQASTDNAIQWFECEQNGTWPLTCGTLAVPLDYTNTSSGRMLNLDLIKINATKGTSRGSILFNPGGPGQGGREFLAGSARQMLV